MDVDKPTGSSGTLPNLRAEALNRNEFKVVNPNGRIGDANIPLPPLSLCDELQATNISDLAILVDELIAPFRLSASSASHEDAYYGHATVSAGATKTGLLPKPERDRDENMVECQVAVNVNCQQNPLHLEGLLPQAVPSDAGDSLCSHFPVNLSETPQGGRTNFLYTSFIQETGQSLPLRPASSTGDFSQSIACAVATTANGANLVAQEFLDTSKLMETEPHNPTVLTQDIVIMSLGALDAAALSDQEAVFVFFVLTIEMGLVVQVEYKEYFDYRWMVRLSCAGIVLEPQKSFSSKFSAKAYCCRGGLEVFKHVYQDWSIPGIPRADATPDSRLWSALLQGYCDIHGLPRTEYTGYQHKQGHRYEVTVGEVSYFGKKKFYVSKPEAIHASANNALYHFLISENEAPVGFPDTRAKEHPVSEALRHAIRAMQNAAPPTVQEILGPKILFRETSELAKIPNVITGVHKLSETKGKKKRKNKQLQNPVNDLVQLLSVNTERAQVSTAAAMGPSDKCPSINPNASKCLPPGLVHLTLAKINNKLNGCPSNVKKVEKMCQFMKIQPPEYRISQTFEELINKKTSMAAYFRDPYFTRMGAVGEVQNITPEIAEETCAANVLEILKVQFQEDGTYTASQEKVADPPSLKGGNAIDCSRRAFGSTSV
ncbi:hypothetical protein LOZ58_004699 [Ophidiomyces ophidiicola]|nr:hypothetical protein LOZ58_004699 [Ophidiomyces ophidiicola]